MSTPPNGFDSLLQRLKTIASDAAHTGFGLIRISGDGNNTELELTIAREKVHGRLEAFDSFALRVHHLTKLGDTVEWTFRDREIVLARITRAH